MILHWYFVDTAIQARAFITTSYYVFGELNTKDDEILAAGGI